MRARPKCMRTCSYPIPTHSYSAAVHQASEERHHLCSDPLHDFPHGELHIKEKEPLPKLFPEPLGHASNPKHPQATGQTE